MVYAAAIGDGSARLELACAGAAQRGTIGSASGRYHACSLVVFRPVREAGTEKSLKIAPVFLISD